MPPAPVTLIFPQTDLIVTDGINTFDVSGANLHFKSETAGLGHSNMDLSSVVITSGDGSISELTLEKMSIGNASLNAVTVSIDTVTFLDADVSANFIHLNASHNLVMGPITPSTLTLTDTTTALASSLLSMDDSDNQAYYNTSHVEYKTDSYDTIIGVDASGNFALSSPTTTLTHEPVSGTYLNKYVTISVDGEEYLVQLYKTNYVPN